MEHESAFIKSFVLPEKQSRWLELLLNPKRRHIFLHRLADDRDFDSKFRIVLLPSQQNPEGIERILKQNGAPEKCHVIFAGQRDCIHFEGTRSLQAHLNNFER